MRFVLPFLLLAGCATPYQPAYNGRDGYHELKLNERAFQVFFTGNVKQDTAHRYALRRAAELTLNAGFPGFVVNDDQTRTEHSLQPGMANCNTLNGRTTCFGGASLTSEPTAQLTIRMLKQEELQSVPAHVSVYDPKLLLSQLQPAAGTPGGAPLPPPNARRVFCGEPGAPC